MLLGLTWQVVGEITDEVRNASMDRPSEKSAIPFLGFFVGGYYRCLLVDRADAVKNARQK